MATPDSSSPASTSAEALSAPSDGAPGAETPPPTPPPEPWTPERAVAWNLYYDRYLVGGLLLLVFLVSAHRIGASQLWPQLKAGELILKKGPLATTTDPFSYSRAGQPWVNVPWLYEVGASLVYGAFPTEPNVAISAIGAGLLVAINAIVRVATAVLLLGLRRRGPGLWWWVVVLAVAMGGVIGPFYSDRMGEQLELALGGIARQTQVGPESFGILLLAGMALLIARGAEEGRNKALYALPALFLLWANLDDSFFFGLLVTTAALGASLIPRSRARDDPAPSPGVVLGVIAASWVAPILNPSLWRIYGAGASPFVTMFSVVFGSDSGSMAPDQVAFFGKKSFSLFASGGDLNAPWLRLWYYLVIVAIGLASFVLNRRRLSPARLAAYLVAALAWGGLARLTGEFAVIFAYSVGRNGQEWYQDHYGVQGRTSSGWTAWSVGGRAITILFLFLTMSRALTGFGYEAGTNRSTFGFGADPSAFDFEAADYLRTAGFKGRVFNLGEQQGDAMIWRAYPIRKTFVDRRRGLPDDGVRHDLDQFRSAFVEDLSDPTARRMVEKPEQWRPILDKYEATVVLFSPRENGPIYEAMRTSTNWIALRDDGRTVLFGRADAKPEDLAFFRENRLDAADLVYKKTQLLKVPDRTPSASTFIDRIIRTRSLAPPQPHLSAAYRWLANGIGPGVGVRPDAAHCYMAIREARTALHFNPDESDAYYVLDRAYDFLLQDEALVLSNKATRRPAEFMAFRQRQRAAALNFSIQTNPPPRNSDERKVLADKYYRLALLYRADGGADLERNALVSARDLVGAAEFPREELQRIEALDEGIGRFKSDMEAASAETNIDPIQRAQRALSAGFPGIALTELEDAEGQGVNADAVLGSLIDLYLRTGQPDKANERLIGRQVNDPALSNGPGTAAYRIAEVEILLGYYGDAVALMRDQAIPAIRYTIASQVLTAGRQVMVGQEAPAIREILEVSGLPGQSGLVETEAEWLAELGLCLLESGQPVEAGKNFVKALEVDPKLPLRPLLEDYLKKLKVPIPGATEEAKPEAKSGA